MRAIAAALCVLAICAGRTDAHGGRVLMQQGFASSSGSPNSVSSSSVSSTTGNDAGTVTSGSVSNNNNGAVTQRTTVTTPNGTVVNTGNSPGTISSSSKEVTPASTVPLESERRAALTEHLCLCFFLSARTRACSRTGTRQKQFRNELEKPLQVNQE
eukprot:jgi/Astpho2/7403/Aster-01990